MPFPLKMHTISSAVLWAKNRRSGENPFFLSSLVLMPHHGAVIEIIPIWRVMTISGYLQRFNAIVANQLTISHNHANLQRQAQEVSMTALPSGRVTLAKTVLHPLLIAAAIVPLGKVERP